MALNFPLNPISGQTYSINGKDWIFNGFAWDAVNIQSAGPQGPQGPLGFQGHTGAQGAQGPRGIQGHTGPEGNTGSSLNYRGDWNGSNNYYPNDYVMYNTLLYVNYTFQGSGSLSPDEVSGAWIQLTLFGETGPQGNTGVQGDVGAKGFTGERGTTGPQGTTGERGTTGPQGNTGVQGDVGPQGNTGSQGETGQQGQTGPQGFIGNQGPTGPQGFQGSAGPQGFQGQKGQSNQFFDYLAITSSTVESYVTGSYFVDGYVAPTAYIIWNNPTQISATALSVSHIDELGDDVDIFLELISAGDKIIIQDRNNSDSYQQWLVSGPLNTTPNTYVEIPVSLVTATGLGYTNFPNGHEVILAISSIGATGPQGPQGDQGPTGIQGYTGPVGLTGSDGPNTIRLRFGASESSHPSATGSFNISGGLSFSASNFLYFNNPSAFSTDSYDVNGANIYNWLNNILTDFYAGRTITTQISEIGNASNYGIYRVSIGTPTPRWTWSLTFVSGNGTFSTDKIYGISEVSSGVIGATGSQGRTGPQGSTGFQGPTGSQGSTGSQGPTGPQGTTGSSGITTGSFGLTIDGGSSVLTSGSKGYVSMPYGGSITGWDILGNVSGSISIDIKKSTYSGFPTTTSITSTNYITLTSQQKNSDSILTGWTVTFSSTDIYEFFVNSASAVTRVNVVVRTNKTS